MKEADLQSFDTEFAHYLERQWGASAGVARLGSRLTAALREGHSCLPVAIGESPAIGLSSQRRPLVIDGENLFLQRVWTLEDRVAQAVFRLTQLTPIQLLPGTVSLAGQLFDAEGPQKLGAFLPFQSGLSVITGGPGTGKTWVLSRLLALQMVQTEGAIRVALCAPTGKAAQRMAQALQSGSPGAPLPQTLHRLLGLGGPLSRPRFHAERPLPFDLVVVDEASMVDLRLMDYLLCALAPTARLVLLGDAGQLPSVDAGRVLGDLVEHLCAHRPSLLVTLTESRRFVAGQAIGIVARALSQGNLEGAWPVLRESTPGKTSCRLLPRPAPATLVSRLLREFQGFLGCSDPEGALEALGQFLILAAVNDGPWGQSGLNKALRGLLPFGAPRPVMITENDAPTGLANGDLGVIWTKDGGEVAWFVLEGEPRGFPVALLPPHQDAFAITIHKSQGSEFDRLAIVIPEVSDGSQFDLSRELIYTAVTRARHHVTLYATPEEFVAAASTPTVRYSGLTRRLKWWQNQPV